MIVRVCVGSSCHLKGAEEIVSLLQEAVTQRHWEDQVTLAGSFCLGQCNRVGVTLQVEGECFPGITPEGFPSFFQEHIASRME